MMRIELKLFGPVRDIVKSDALQLQVPEPCTGEAVIDILAGLYPAIAPWKKSLLLAVNREYVPFDCELRTDDEVALIPPVAGG
jgi:molybdopterin converting factor subunit 1